MMLVKLMCVRFNVTRRFKINDVSETDVSKNQRNEKL